MQCLWSLPEIARATSADKPQDRCYQESKSREEFRYCSRCKEKGICSIVINSVETARWLTRSVADSIRS